MKIIVYAFTNTGKKLAADLKNKWENKPEGTVHIWDSAEMIKGIYDAVGKVFYEADTYALLFIGAVGIAVRTVAPFIRNKLTDPAVLAMDECAQHVIPVLSGHYGGANELALKIAQLTGAAPVITTATDLQKCFAVDVFARMNQLCILEPERIKTVSSALLRGETAGICSELPAGGELPEGLQWMNEKTEIRQKPEIGIYIGYDPKVCPFTHTLHLMPRDIIAGIGCRKGKTKLELMDFLMDLLRELHIDRNRMAAVASIDKKAAETGILEMAEELRVPFVTYSAEVLGQIPGVYASSEFVTEQMGVDNVCERSAAAAAGNGAVWLSRKRVKSGMTLAVMRVSSALHF